MRKKGYEYEMSIPSIDQERAAIVVDRMSLTRSSGFMARRKAMTVCGVALHAIRMTRELDAGGAPG